MVHLRVWLLAASSIGLAGAACGGHVVAGQSNGGTTRDGGTAMRDATTGDATTGNAVSAPTGGSGGSAIGTIGAAGSGSGNDWDGSPGPDGCVHPWWGSTLDGVAGLRSCPPPYDPALLAYGQTEYDQCFKVTGPTSTQQVGETTSCCYVLDETACNSSYVGGFCTELPYFGDGSKAAKVPGTSVADQLASCSLPAGMPLAPSTQAERANLLIGVWLKCGGGSPQFSANALVFRGDGTFRMLQLDSTGHLVETSGCNQTGLWGFISNPDQLNLYVDSGTYIGHASFTNGIPHRFRYDGLPGNPEFVALQ